MNTHFAGFPEPGMAFLRGLKRNNKREWFQARKQVYEEMVKAPMVEMVEALNESLASRVPDFVTEPAKAIYRIYRDTRFSSDKTPYKTHIAASFFHGRLAKHAAAGFYFSVSPEEIEVAAGLYMPGPEQLLAVRSHIADRHAEFRRLITAKALVKAMGTMQGQQLSRAPKGFPPQHPAGDLIRYKQWLFYTILDGGLAATSRLFGEVARRFELLTPFVEFLNRPLLTRKKTASAADL